jgi:hypothetical protein
VVRCKVGQQCAALLRVRQQEVGIGMPGSGVCAAPQFKLVHVVRLQPAQHRGPIKFL